MDEQPLGGCASRVPAATHPQAWHDPASSIQLTCLTQGWTSPLELVFPPGPRVESSIMGCIFQHVGEVSFHPPAGSQYELERWEIPVTRRYLCCWFRGCLRCWPGPGPRGPVLSLTLPIRAPLSCLCRGLVRVCSTRQLWRALCVLPLGDACCLCVCVASRF